MSHNGLTYVQMSALHHPKLWLARNAFRIYWPSCRVTKRVELTSSDILTGHAFALEHEVGAECQRGGLVSGRSDAGERLARGS